MNREDLPASASRTRKRRVHTTRRGLLSIPPLVAVASVLTVRPAQASIGAVECVADLGAF